MNDLNDPGPAGMNTGGLALPQSVEAEKELLAAVLVDQSAMDVLLENELEEEYFYAPRHQLIFRAMHALYDLNESIDEVTLPQRMKDDGTFEQAGGYQALSALLNRSM